MALLTDDLPFQVGEVVLRFMFICLFGVFSVANRRGKLKSDAGCRSVFMLKGLYENRLRGSFESGPACCLVGLHFAEPDYSNELF